MNALQETAQALHDELDAMQVTTGRGNHKLRILADDVEQLASDPLQLALDHCNARQGEFWQRLAGSIRKALTMI